MALRDYLVNVFNTDTWANVLSGLGVAGRDRRRNTRIDVDIVTEEEARQMWQTDFLARACIEKIPSEAFREGFNVKIRGGNQDLAESVQGRLEDLLAVPQFVEAAKFERAYGGSGLFPVLNDGTKDLTTRLNEASIMSCSAIHVFEPRELQVRTWYDDITDPKYRRPRSYLLQPRGSIGVTGQMQEIHESRLIILPGVRVSNDQTPAERPGWGDNALSVAKQTLADFGIGFGSVMAMLDQFSQGVLALNGLGDMLAQDAGKKVRDRLMIMDQTKSILRTLVVDKEDSFKREHVSFSGIPDVLKMGMYFVSAALDIPVALLFGMEPTGMNATGAFDIRSFYDRVGNVQTSRYETPVERLIRLTTMLPKDGPTKGIEPAQWSIEWKPLWQQSDKEREDTRKVRTENDIALIEAGIATADEIREQRFGGDTYSYELQLEGAAPVPEVPATHVARLQAGVDKTGRGAQQRRAMIEAALVEPAPDDAAPDDGVENNAA